MAAANPKKVIRQLHTLTGGQRWDHRGGQYVCPINSEIGPLMKGFLSETYPDLNFRYANGILSISGKEGTEILQKESVFATPKDFEHGVIGFLERQQTVYAEKTAADEAAALEAAKAAEAAVLSDDDVLHHLHKATKLSWTRVSDGASALNGTVATPGVSHKLAEQQQRLCTQKGLSTEITDEHGKYHLTVEPEAARSFAEKRASKAGASHAERTEDRKDFGVA